MISKILHFSAFSLEFQNFFLITRIIFSHSRSEQFWLQNTISLNELHVNICIQDQVKAEYKFPLILEYIYANTGWQQVAKGISIRHRLTIIASDNKLKTFPFSSLLECQHSYYIHTSKDYQCHLSSITIRAVGIRRCGSTLWDNPRTATDMDGTLHTDLWKSETSREIKKSF